MRRSWWRAVAAGAAVVLSGADGAGAQTTPAALLRTALIVADADRSAAFYRVLGFEPESELDNPRDPKTSTFPVNVPSTAVRLVILGNPMAEGARLGLVQFSSPPATSTRGDVQKVGVGDITLVFDVIDAEATHAALRAAGARILEPPQTFTSRTRDASGRALTGKVFHVLDPDGYLIELLQAAR